MRGKKTLTAFIVLVILVVGGYGFYYYNTKSTVEAYEDRVYPGVKIENANVGGKNKEEVKKIVSKLKSDLSKDGEIALKYNDKSFSVKKSNLNISVNEDEVIEAAMRAGKTGTIFKRASKIRNGISDNIKFHKNIESESLSKEIAKIKTELDIPPKDAALEKEGDAIKVIEENIGITVDVEETKNNLFTSLMENKKEADIAVHEEKPKITKDTLKGVNTLLSSYTTNFGNTSTKARAHNVTLAASKVNNILLMPGEVFSFNEKIGDTSEAAGYEKAKVYVGNEIKEGIAGGVCQTSSTLYAATIHTPIEIVERTNHSMPLAYIPTGFDATVSSSGVDFKFKNNQTTPIFIKSTVDNGNLTYEIYGDSSLKNKEYKVRTETYEVTEPETEYVQTEELKSGEQKVEINPVEGSKVKVIKEIYENGNKVSDNVISDDKYKPINKVIKVGV